MIWSNLIVCLEILEGSFRAQGALDPAKAELLTDKTSCRLWRRDYRPRREDNQGNPSMSLFDAADGRRTISPRKSPLKTPKQATSNPLAHTHSFRFQKYFSSVFNFPHPQLFLFTPPFPSYKKAGISSIYPSFGNLVSGGLDTLGYKNQPQERGRGRRVSQKSSRVVLGVRAYCKGSWAVGFGEIMSGHRRDVADDDICC
jgi:hypothetical protein